MLVSLTIKTSILVFCQSSKELTEHAAKAAECDHLRAGVLFVKELEQAGKKLSGMLGSTTTSDVIEALRFFVTVSEGDCFTPAWLRRSSRVCLRLSAYISID